MKYCSQCGQQNSTNAKFCYNCGNPLPDIDSQSVGKNDFSQHINVQSDRECLNNAIIMYNEEFATFKKKWTIAIILGCMMYGIPGIILYCIYSFHSRPQFEKQLVERYKKEHS